MSKILAGLDGVLLFGKGMEKHCKRFAAALKRTAASEARVNPDKCELRKNQLKFLGHVIDGDGIWGHPSKIAAVTVIKLPTNTSDKTSLIHRKGQSAGRVLSEFSWHLILNIHSNFSSSNMSTRLWRQEQFRAFYGVQAELTKATVLTLYNPQASTKVCADASSYSVGAVWCRRTTHTISLLLLTQSDRHYDQMKKNALAMTCYVGMWKVRDLHTVGVNFLVEADYKPLEPLEEPNTLTAFLLKSFAYCLWLVWQGLINIRSYMCLGKL